jgi:hypothetical protein
MNLATANGPFPANGNTSNLQQILATPAPHRWTCAIFHTTAVTHAVEFRPTFADTPVHEIRQLLQ